MKTESKMSERVRDAVAIVTGGGGNPSIGRSVAIRLAEEGAKVAVFDIDVAGAEAAAAEIVAGGGEAIACGCDVLDVAGIEAQVKCMTETWGRRVDILVNSAAWYKGMGGFKAFDEWTEAQWDKMMAVNVKGLCNMAKAVVPIIKENHYCKLVIGRASLVSTTCQE